MIKETLLASAFGLLGLVTVACGFQKKDQMGDGLVLGRVCASGWCESGN